MKDLLRSNWRLAVLFILLAVLVSFPFPFYERSWHKFMHIFGAMLFLGNIVVTAVWMILAAMTNQRAVIHFAAKAVTQADLVFTIPGVLLILINGVTLAPAFGDGDVLGASWVVAALGLLTLSGVIWLVFLLRYQAQMIAVSGAGVWRSDDFKRVFLKWGIWGGIGTILPIISLVLMVFKPTLWE